MVMMNNLFLHLPATLGSRYTKPVLQAAKKKNEHTINTKGI